MDFPPWFGEPGAYNQPDPLIYWVFMPPLAYLWAIYVAWMIAQFINLNARDDEAA